VIAAALASLLALLPCVPGFEADASAPAPGTPGASLVPSLADTPVRSPSTPLQVLPRIGEAQLAPVFAPRSPAAEGKAAYDAGDHALAAARLAGAREPAAAYLRALALLELDRNAEALRALDGLEAALPELADRVRFLRAEALAGAGRRDEAIQVWSSVPDGSLLGPQARLGRARLAAALNDRAGALEALAPLLASSAQADPSRPDPSATALLLAGRILAAGPGPDLASARKSYLACWVAHPLAPEATEALHALRSMAIPFSVPPGPEEVLARAESLLDQNRSEAAIALLEPLAAAVKGAAPDAPLACRIRAALGRAERRERNTARAVELLRPVVESCKDPGVRVRALYVLAGATVISGDREQGIALYRRLEREYPGHSYADDSLLYAAQLLARQGQEGDAREILAAVVDGYPDGDQRSEARFLQAWLSRRAGELDQAMAQLEAIEKASLGVDPYEHARAAYWRARILRDRDDAGKDAARQLWTELARRYPTDYYGLLAQARLAELGAAIPQPRPPMPALAASYDPGPLRDDPHLRAGLLLFRIGLPKAAADELEAVPLGRIKPGEPLDPVLLVADVLDRLGDHRAAHQILRTRARDAFRRAPDADNLRAWLIAYPPAYREDVERSARAAAVPADLVQALMREESALDPRIISPAGAVGLTQLMLPTARQVAARLHLTRPTRADLMQPSINIRIGAQYLGELVRRYDGEVALALAAYNAGAAAVTRWQEALPAAALDEFVEQIPVEETRGYVKRVLRSYAAYATLYGDGLPPGAHQLLRVANQ
jgi:soluble lytic murein transglycosylase